MPCRSPQARPTPAAPTTAAQPRASAAVNASNGRAPGVHVTIVHDSLPGNAPTRNAGTSPANVSDDFPDPDGPTTARNWLVFNFSTSRWTSPSRPKNQALSASRNGNNPRYGHTSRRPGTDRRALDRQALHRSHQTIDARQNCHPPRRSTHVRMLKNGSIAVGSNGSGIPGNNTKNTRNAASCSARSNATFTSGRCHAPISARTHEHRTRRRLTQTRRQPVLPIRSRHQHPHVQPRPQPPRPQLLRQTLHHRLVHAVVGQENIKPRLRPRRYRRFQHRAGPPLRRRQQSRRLHARTCPVALTNVGLVLHHQNPQSRTVGERRTILRPGGHTTVRLPALRGRVILDCSPGRTSVDTLGATEPAPEPPRSTHPLEMAVCSQSSANLSATPHRT